MLGDVTRPLTSVAGRWRARSRRRYNSHAVFREVSRLPTSKTRQRRPDVTSPSHVPRALP